MSSQDRRFSLKTILASDPKNTPESQEVPKPEIETAKKPMEEPSGSSLRTSKRRAQEAHRSPKRKRSYTVDLRLVEELELLAWYHNRSCSSIVEDLVRKHLGRNRELVEKAKSIRKDMAS